MVREAGRRGVHLSPLQGRAASAGAAEVQPDFVGRVNVSRRKMWWWIAFDDSALAVDAGGGASICRFCHLLVYARRGGVFCTRIYDSESIYDRNRISDIGNWVDVSHR